MKGTARLLLCLAITASLMLTACSGTSSESSGSSDQAITIATTDGIESLDSATAYVGWSMQRDGVVETLVGVDDKLGLKPELATAWKNINPTTWELTLRDGVVFHDGSPMTPDAVKASLEHSLKTNVRASSQLLVASIAAKGHKITITTSKPVAVLPQVLTDPMLGIQKVGDGVDPNTKPIATGPFAITKHVPKSSRTLVAHDKYWGGKPKLKTVTVKDYADNQAMALAVQSGEADVVVRPDATSLDQFSDTSRFTQWTTMSTRSDAIIFNTTSPTVKDLKVRQAIAHAVDRGAYVKVLRSMATPSLGFFPDTVAFGGTAGRTATATKKDLNKTKALLKNAGYTEKDGKLVKNGKPLTLKTITYTKRPYLGEFAQLLRSDLSTIGVTLDVVELKASEDVMKAGEFDIAMYSMVMAPTGGPDYFYETMLRSNSATNYSHYKSPAFDTSLNKLATITDLKQRNEASKKAEQILLNDLPYLVIGNQKWWVVSSSKVKDLHLRPTEHHMLTAATHLG